MCLSFLPRSQPVSLRSSPEGELLSGDPLLLRPNGGAAPQTGSGLLPLLKPRNFPPAFVSWTPRLSGLQPGEFFFYQAFFLLHRVLKPPKILQLLGYGSAAGWECWR